MSLDTIYYGSAEIPKPDTNPENLRVYGHPL